MNHYPKGASNQCICSSISRACLLCMTITPAWLLNKVGVNIQLPHKAPFGDVKLHRWMQLTQLHCEPWWYVCGGMLMVHVASLPGSRAGWSVTGIFYTGEVGIPCGGYCGTECVQTVCTRLFFLCTRTSLRTRLGWHSTVQSVCCVLSAGSSTIYGVWYCSPSYLPQGHPSSCCKHNMGMLFWLKWKHLKDCPLSSLADL